MRTVFNDGSPVWLKAISGLLLATFAGILILLLIGSVSADDSEKHVRELKANYEKLVQEHCDTIANLTVQCFGPKHRQCDRYTKALQWFNSADGYNQPADSLCSKVEKPFFLHGVE